MSFRHPGVPPEDEQLEAATVSPNLTIDEASPYVLMHTPSAFQRMIASNYSYGFENDEERLKENGLDHTKVSFPYETAPHPRFIRWLTAQWSNPLEVQYVPTDVWLNGHAS